MSRGAAAAKKSFGLRNRVRDILAFYFHLTHTPCPPMLVREFFFSLEIPLENYVTGVQTCALPIWIDESEANNNRAHKFFLLLILPSLFMKPHIRPGATEIWVCARYFSPHTHRSCHVIAFQDGLLCCELEHIHSTYLQIIFLSFINEIWDILNCVLVWCW